jgi:hypothetical protein
MNETAHIVDIEWQLRQARNAIDAAEETNTRLRALNAKLVAACELALRMLREHGQTHDDPRPDQDGDYLDAYDTGESGPLSSILEAAIAKAKGQL